MVLTKLIGSIVLVGAGVGSYLEMQKFQKKRVYQLNAFIDLIEYIKNQVECFLLPFDIILRKCDPKILSACGIECETSTIKSMKELISSTVFYCDDEIVEILTGFADSFGKAYSKEQIASCEYCRSELLKKREKLLEKDSKNKKIQLALCLSISFSLIILLI